MNYELHDLTAHGTACHQCRTLLDEARVLYRTSHRVVRVGNHPAFPGYRGGCWAETWTSIGATNEA